jgi:hypothetical protein
MTVEASGFSRLVRATLRRKGVEMKKVLWSCLVVVMLLSTVGISQAYTVSSGYIDSATLVGAVRYKAFSRANEKEVYLGVPDLGDDSNRTQQDISWQVSQEFTFTYDADTDILSTKVGTNSTIYHNISDPLVDLNYIQWLVRAKTGTTVEMSNAFLNGESLGSFSATGEGLNWYILGVDLNDGFTFTGIINLTGTDFGNEHSKIEIGFGSAVPIPGAVWLLGSGLVGLLGFRKRFKFRK